MSYLIDSNILIYFLNNLLSPEAEAFLKRAMLNRAYVSVMTRIEILGWPDAETSSAQSTIDLINQLNASAASPNFRTAGLLPLTG